MSGLISKGLFYFSIFNEANSLPTPPRTTQQSLNNYIKFDTISVSYHEESFNCCNNMEWSYLK